MDIDVPAGVTPADLERFLVSGPTGVRERFAAVGANEYYYEHASARHYDQSAAVLKKVGPDQVGQWLRAADGKQRVHLWWDDCAGEMSMVAAYAEHLLVVRAHELDLLGDEEPRRPGPESGYVEVGGRLAKREGTGLYLQAIHSKDQSRVAAADMSDAERAAFDALAGGCACPACAAHLWTAADADAIAARFEAGDAGALVDLHRCFVMTPRLLEALLRTSAHLESASFWRRRHTAAARSRAEALLGSDDVEVRASARGIAILGSEEADAVDHVRAALADAPVVARAALTAWSRHRWARFGSIATWSEKLVRPLAPAMVDVLTTTTDAELASKLIGFIAWYPRVVAPDVFARFKKALAPWTKNPVTQGSAQHAKKVRQR